MNVTLFSFFFSQGDSDRGRGLVLGWAFGTLLRVITGRW